MVVLITFGVVNVRPTKIRLPPVGESYQRKFTSEGKFAASVALLPAHWDTLSKVGSFGTGRTVIFIGLRPLVQPVDVSFDST